MSGRWSPFRSHAGATEVLGLSMDAVWVGAQGHGASRVIFGNIEHNGPGLGGNMATLELVRPPTDKGVRIGPPVGRMLFTGCAMAMIER